MPFARYPHFCFVKNLIIGLVMDGAESKGTNNTIEFFRWSL